MGIRTALIIDPQGELLATAAPELERFGITVVGMVGYGLGALESAFFHKPDLILIRVAAPRARPLQIIQRLRDALPDSPIVGILGDPKSGVSSSVIAAGGFACVPEPVRPGALAPVIKAARDYFERRHRAVRMVAGQGGQIITVLGSKGGVGKTTVAVNLAIALGQESHAAIALVDADPLFGDVSLALDLGVQRSLADVVANLGELDTTNIREFMAGKFGVWVLPASARPRDGGEVTGADLTGVLDRLRNAFDFVVVDTGGAFTDLTAAAAEGASARILVTTTDLNSVRDTARTLQWLRQTIGQAAEPTYLLQNRVGMPGGLAWPAVDREVGLATTWYIHEDSPPCEGNAGRGASCGAVSKVPGFRDHSESGRFIRPFARNHQCASRNPRDDPMLRNTRRGRLTP